MAGKQSLPVTAQNLVAGILQKELPDKSWQECNAIGYEIIEKLTRFSDLGTLCVAPAGQVIPDPTAGARP